VRAVRGGAAPSGEASCTMNSDSAVVMRSPTAGKSPINASKPKRTLVPGQDERGVEQGRKRVDPGNAGATGAGTRKVGAPRTNTAVSISTRPPRSRVADSD